MINKVTLFFFFWFHTGFRPTNGWRLIRLVRRGMRTGQVLFPLEIEPGIPWVRPWKELLATGAQSTWFTLFLFQDGGNIYF
jgi:hypothetical protein